MKINTVENEKDLKRLFNFLSKTFYADAKKNGEHYYTMYERYNEMKKQFLIDKDMLMFIENDNEIIAGITGKNIDFEKKSITLGIMAVDLLERRKGFAKMLVREFEYRCIKKGIFHIELGSRFRAIHLYKSLNYNFMLMVQVFDFATIEDVRKNNKYSLKEKTFYQGDTYGFIIYYVDDINEKYITNFEKDVETAHVQYLFEKDL